eukprot:gene19102-24936_t
MFYSQLILARKGPLGKIWIAAHYDKKLTKAQIFSTDISDSVQSVLNPAAPLALRVSGHLMLGIVRIYSRKVRYLMADCTEAMWKMKLEFRPGAVDLPEGQVYTTSNVDDLRYFGNLSIDQEFPELSDVAYPRQYIGLDDRLVAADLESIQERKMSSLDESWSKPVSSTRVSDIELARRDSIRQSQSFARSSISSATKRPGSLPIQMEIDEDIPAFEEQDEALTALPQQVIEQPQFDFSEFDHVAPPEFEIPFEEEKAVAMTEEELVVESDKETGTKIKKRRKVKKYTPQFDERVELSSKFIKDLMADRSSLLRRQPYDPLDPLDQPVLKPLGFCNQLENTFNTTLNFGEFPFIKKAEKAESIERAPSLSPEFETARGISLSPEFYPAIPLEEIQQPIEEVPTITKTYEEPTLELQIPYESEITQYPDYYPQYDEQPLPAVEYADVGEEHWTARTKQVYAVITDKLQSQQSVEFQSLSKSVSRRTAALCFFEVLQLKSWNSLELNQSEPFANIDISISV